LLEALVKRKKRKILKKRRQMGSGPRKMSVIKTRRKKTKDREQETINKRDHAYPKQRLLLE